MSDIGRKDFTTKAKEELVGRLSPEIQNIYLGKNQRANLYQIQTPDNSKSTLQKIKEGVTDTTDRKHQHLHPIPQLFPV